MEKTCDLLLGPGHAAITALLKATGALAPVADTLPHCFTQEEEFFLELPQPLTIPALDVHHNVHQLEATEEYIAAVTGLVRELTRMIPAALVGLNWFFDPRDTLHPLFVQALSSKDKRYLYLLRIDLTCRPRHAETLERATNSRTARYRTNRLFLESEVLPLDALDTSTPEKKLYLAKLFQNTWKGESGRRYHIEGQWIDQDITKFLTRSVLAPKRKSFPFYPLRCRYNTLSSTCLELSPEGRRKSAAILDLMWTQVAPRASIIQNRLQDAPFSENDELFAQVRTLCQPLIEPRLGSYRLEAYLNEQEQKEYRFYAE